MEQNDSELLKVVTQKLDALIDAMKKQNDVNVQLHVAIAAVQKQIQQLAENLKVKLPS